MIHVDTWRAAYRGIVPDDYLDGLSYDDTERLWQDVIVAGDGRVFVAEAEGGIFGRASGRPRERFSRDLTEYEGEPRNGLRPPSHGGNGAGAQLVRAVVGHLAGRGVNSLLLWVFAEKTVRPAASTSRTGVSPSWRTTSRSAARGRPRWLTDGRTWTSCSSVSPGVRARRPRPLATGRRLCGGSPSENGAWARTPSPG